MQEQPPLATDEHDPHRDLIGPRTGYADLEARVRTEIQPGRLAGAVGVWYDEFSNLTGPVEVVGSGPLELPAQTTTATSWVEGLNLVGSRGARGVPPPLPRPLARRHHPGARSRPRHLCRHRSRPRFRRSLAPMGPPGTGSVDVRQSGDADHQRDDTHGG